MIKNISYNKIEATFTLRYKTLTKLLEDINLDFAINEHSINAIKNHEATLLIYI